MQLSLNQIFIAADIFYGAENKDRWRSVDARKVYETMVRINAPRFNLALERADIINASFDSWQAFNNDRTITWENGDVEPADIGEAIFGDHIRRPVDMTTAA